MALSDRELAERHHLSVEQVQRLRDLRGTSNQSLAQLAPAAIPKALRKLSLPDAAEARARHEALLARGDEGRAAPRAALPRAIAQTARMRESGRPARKKAAATPGARLLRGALRVAADLMLRHVAGVPARGALTPLALVGAAPATAPMPAAAVAGLALPSWQWLGPGNIGGRTRAIAIHPREPQRMLAASAGGGVWFTENGGARWDPVDDFMANLAVCCLAIDPTNPNLVYAGTGEGFGNVDALRGGGIFRIVDGRRWELIAATRGFSAVNRIAVSRNGRSVLAATPEGLMRSTDAARAVWTRVLAAPMADVKFDPNHSSRAVAAATSGGQAWISSNGGASWQPAAHGAAPWFGRVELAYARRDPRVVYASVAGDLRQGVISQLWRSSDRGRTFQLRDAIGPDGRPAAFLGGQGWYGNVVWAGDPSDADLVIVGGVDLWRSRDGGQTMAEISTWWDPRSAHADHHAIVAHPGYDGVANRSVFFGNDGGVYRADDILAVGNEPDAPYVAGWTELNNNYGVTQFFGGAVHAGSGRVVAGAQDNGCLALQPGAGSEHWNSWSGGDGGWCAADPQNPNRFYGEYVYLCLHRNDDGASSDDPDRYICGQFWNSAASPQRWDWKQPPFLIADAKNEQALFIAPFVLDARNPSRILGGGASLWQTTDARAPLTPTSGPRWRAIKPPIAPGTRDYISAVAIAPADSAVVWVGHVSGAVFRSADATAQNPTWQRLGTGAAQPLAPRRYCTRITPHPTEARTAYASFGGFVTDNIWRTTDAGATWTPLGRSLPAAPVRCLAIHPRRHGFLYAGTEVGVFASEDGGTTWSPTNEGPANVSVDELFWGGETLYAATHGRGMYRIDLSAV